MKSFFENVQEKLVSHGYPVECFKIMDCKEGTFVSAHWHQFAEIIYVTEGCYQVIVNGVYYNLQQGELLYILPGQIHTTICPKMERIGLIVLKFDTNLLLSVSESCLEKDILRPFIERSIFAGVLFTKLNMETIEAKKLLNDILCELKDCNIGYLVAVRNTICNLVLKLLRNCQAVAGSEDSGRIYGIDGVEELYQILTFIESNYDKEIKIEELLDMQNLSYSNFAAKFKRVTGDSLITYVNKVRIKQAQKFLKDVSLPINEIAIKCGFSDVCYFNRVFRKYSNQSPRDYRNNSKA